MDSETNEILLCDNFVDNKTKNKVKIDLYKDAIKFYNMPNKNNIPDLILSINDVSGSSIAKGLKKNDPKSYLTIYAYIKSNKNSDLRRKRVTYELACSNYPTYDENLSYVNKWHKMLDRLLKIKSYKLDPVSDEFSVQKPFLIFINPKAGSGKAKNIYFERVLPVFSEANIADTVVFTQYQNFAKEYVKNLKVEDYKAILVISGDGLVHEILNGLMEREDWENAIKIPIGHIPGGSANALSCCVAYLSKEAFRNLSLEAFATQASFNITKSLSIPMDLVVYELSNKKTIYSFLSFEWAIVADVDLESEKYRFLGGLRFAVGALKRILSLRIYRGKLSFLPADEHKNYVPKNPSINLIRNNQDIEIDQVHTHIEIDNKKTKFKYLNPIDKPVPIDWLTIEENFVLVLIVYLPLISPDFLATPQSTFNDGNMHLLFIKEGISKAQLLQLFTDTENGNHLKSEFVEYIKIKAFRLEPLGLASGNSNDDNGVMMVDGERIPYGITQAEIFPSFGNILANLKD